MELWDICDFPLSDERSWKFWPSRAPQQSKHHPASDKPVRHPSPSQYSAPSLSVNSLFWKAWCIIQHKSVKIWEQPLTSQAPPAVSHGCHRLGRVRDGHPPQKFFLKKCLNVNSSQSACLLHMSTYHLREIYKLAKWKWRKKKKKPEHTHVHEQIIKSIIRYTTTSFVLKAEGCTGRSQTMVNFWCDLSNEHKKGLKCQLGCCFTGELS